MSLCEFAKASARCLRHERGNNLKFLEVKVVAADTEVFNDVANNAARHIARMPCKSDEPVGTKWI